MPKWLLTDHQCLDYRMKILILFTICFVLIDFTNNGVQAEAIHTLDVYNRTENGITTVYRWYQTTVDWEESQRLCALKGERLLCYDEEKEIEDLLDRTTMINNGKFRSWTHGLDCSKPPNKCSYVAVEDYFLPLDYSVRKRFNCSARFSFICERTLPPLTALPSTTTPTPQRNVSCQGERQRNIDWPKTQGNTMASRPCPNGRTGNAEWFCDKNGQWIPENPDLSECYLPSLHAMYEEIGTKNITHTTNALEKLLARILDLYGGSLRMAVQILESVDDVSEDQIKDLQPFQKEKFVGDVSNAVVATCDRLLAITHAWNDLPPAERYSTANQFLTAVDETGLLLAMNIPTNRQETIRQEKIALAVERRPKSYFQNRNLTFTFGDDENKTVAQLTLVAGFDQQYAQETQVSFAWYSDLSQILPNNGSIDDGWENLTLNSAVVSANLSGFDHATVLPKGVIIVLQHNEEEAADPKCVFWDGGRQRWSGGGCKVLETNQTHTICQCNHLTNFAILMDVNCATCRASAIHQATLSIISSIGCFISIFCLIITIFVLTWYRALWGIRTSIHRNLCLSLLVAQIILLVGLEQTQHVTGCSVIAGLLHFFFLAVFFWMFLEAVQILFLLIQVFTSDDAKVYPYYLVGYGCPAIIVGITAGVRTQDLTGKYCWLSTDNYTIWAYLGPVAAILLFNTITMAYALFTTHRITRNYDKDGSDNLKLWVRGSAVLMPILGLTWSVGFFYLITDSLVIPYLFTILNSIQGLGIFIFHCLLNKKVQHLIRHTIRRRHTQSFNITRTQSSSRSSRSSDRSKFWIRKPAEGKPSVLSDATPVTLVAIDPDEIPKATDDTVVEEEIEPTETTALRDPEVNADGTETTTTKKGGPAQT